MAGRYGPYVTDGTTNASLPRGADPGTVTIANALELLEARRNAGPEHRSAPPRAQDRLAQEDRRPPKRPRSG